MDVVMNGLLIAATLFAGLYCHVLASRVRALKSLDSGLGGSIVTLTRQIELARATLEEARAGARETRQDLGQLTARADAAGARLRLLLAAVEPAGPVAAPPPEPPPATPEPPLAARRRESPGPRLVPPPEPEADPEPEAEAPTPLFADHTEPGLPKPRRTMTLDALLRRRAAAPEPVPEPQSEAELLAALSALAGGER